MALLSWAWLLVATVPFDRWRGSLGLAANEDTADRQLIDAQRSATYIEWAARLLPIHIKCLPRAMALSWILRRKRISHVVVFAVRPEELRGSNDDLHAWVEVGREKVIGNLPGPWLETLRLGTGAFYR